MMGNRFTRVLAVALLCAAPAAAQTQPRNPWSVRGGLGFTASPTAFMFGVETEREVADQFGLGANVQVALSDEETIVSPTLFARYRLDLGSMDEALAPIEPSFRAGIGFTHENKEVAFNHDIDDTVFLMDLGMGVEYRLNPSLAVGTLMHFNIMPTGIFDNTSHEDHFYFAWEVLTLRWSF